MSLVILIALLAVLAGRYQRGSAFAKLKELELREWNLSGEFALSGKKAALVNALDPASVAACTLDEDEVVRVSALIALCHVGTTTDIASVEESFARFRSTRFESGIALAKLGRGSKPVVEFIGRYLTSQDRETILSATNALGLIEHHDAVHYLGALVHHSDSSVRATILEALRRYGGRDIIPLLIEFVDEVEPAIACSGLDRLRRIWLGPVAIDELEERTGVGFGRYIEVPALISEPEPAIKQRWMKWWSTCGESYKPRR